MRAVVCKDWGPPSNLVIEDIPSPTVKTGHVHVRVHACGLYYGDVLLIGGQYQFKPPLPFTPGTEFAGEILEVGEGVSGFQVGDRVMGVNQYNSFAEEVVTPSASLFLIPDEMDYIDAAGFLINYGTAYTALKHRGQLQEGETLLVHGAAGGVGLAAVEIGKLLGARVIATASTPEKLALAQKYGADEGINYQSENFKDRVKEFTGGQGAEVIFDPVGGDVFDLSTRCIKWEGRLLVIGFASGRIPAAPANIMLVKNFSVVGVFWGSYIEKDNSTFRALMEELIDLYTGGKLKPYISKTLPFERITEGLDALLARKATGKIVVTLD